MTSTTHTANLLGMARAGTSRRLHDLAKVSERFTPEQLTLMHSLLDEFDRKSRAGQRQRAQHMRAHPAAQSVTTTSTDQSVQEATNV